MKKHFSKGFLGDQSGQTLLEYLAIGVLILLVVIAAIQAIGAFLERKAEDIEGSF